LKRYRVVKKFNPENWVNDEMEMEIEINEKGFKFYDEVTELRNFRIEDDESFKLSFYDIFINGIQSGQVCQTENKTEFWIKREGKLSDWEYSCSGISRSSEDVPIAVAKVLANIL